MANATQSLSPLAAEVKAFLAAHLCESVFVTEVARAIGYSPGHAAARFKREYHSSLKAFLDEERASEAQRLLSYSDAGISEIARQLSFPDVYAFSRFVRRMTGMSPRAFRAQLANDARG